jgi:hypothetical protein
MPQTYGVTAVPQKCLVEECLFLASLVMIECEMVISIENKAVHFVCSFVSGNMLFSAYYCVLVE